MALRADRWIVLHLQSISPFTVVEVSDETSRPPRVITLPSGSPFSPIQSPWLADLVRTTTDVWSARTGATPAFLSFAADLDAIDVEVMFGAVFGIVRPVYLSRATPPPRTQFNLPLKLVAVGTDADQWVSRLLGNWWAADEVVRSYGLQVQTSERDASTLIHALAPHVVVTDQPDEMLEAAARLPEPMRPRLLVWADETLGSPAPAARRADVPGVAVLRIGASSPDQIAVALETLGLGFAHDQPLHEVAPSAAHSSGAPVRLTADPWSLHGIRLSEVLRSLRQDAQRLEAQWPAARSNAAIGSWLEDAQRPRDFLGESHAFVPLAHMLQHRDTARAVFHAAAADARNEGLRAFPTMGEPEPRAVHVALERLESSPCLSALDRRTTLGSGLAYQVRLHIGATLPDSLVDNPVPIGPALGPPDNRRGYDLEVAIQGKDFEVLSPATVPLFLPCKGGSEPVYFEVRSPRQLGHAQLRLCVYHRNHLVQSHVLDAIVGPAESVGATNVLSVRLEMSFVDHLDEANRLGARALSLGVNTSSDGRHNIIVKATGVAQEVALKATTFEQTSDEIRKILAEAAADPTNPAAARNYTKLTLGDAPPVDVAATIRTLVDWGCRLYGAFFDRVALPGSPLRAELVRLIRSSGEALQVVRFSFEDVFLWPLLYDWDRPTDPAAEVCLGWQLDAAGVAVACNHDASSNLYCVRGFWGVRHRVEERIEQPAGSVTSVKSPVNGKPVRVIADSALPGGSTLPGDLVTDLGAVNVDSGPALPKALLDLLFNEPDERPALLILLGHHEQQTGAPGTSLSRIQTDATPTWLSEEDVRARAKKCASAWDQPRSLVLLMGCDSATTKMTTLTNFVTVWSVAGAGAIVGTEAVVGSTLAADFARRFSKRVWQHKERFGHAMTAIRAELLGEGSPLAFVFHAFGDVDLVLN